MANVDLLGALRNQPIVHLAAEIGIVETKPDVIVDNAFLLRLTTGLLTAQHLTQFGQ